MIDPVNNNIIDKANYWVKYLPVWLKFAFLFIISCILFFFSDFYVISLTFFAVLLIYRLAGITTKLIFHSLLKLWWLLAALFLIQWLNSSWLMSLIVTLRLAILLLIANLINQTTKTSDMLDAFERFFALLRPLGINPAKAALTVSLTIRFVHVIKIMSDEIRQAQKARGLEHSFLALFIPLLIRIAKMSDDVAQAILARSYDNNDKE